MKRKLIGLLCVCMLLSGCGVDSSKPLQTESPITEAAVTDQPLLEQGRTLAESENLLYIPNRYVESMAAPEMRLLGNGLLLSEYRDNVLVLKHISLEDGGIVQEGSVPGGEGTKLSIGSGEIGLCDRESGMILVLDESFRIVRSYSVTDGGDDWYLNSELDTLFIFFADRGVLAKNLETGENTWLVDNGFSVTASGSGNSYVIFAYTDRADQKTCTLCLNLSTASLETMPVGVPVSGGFRQGDTWLLRSSEEEGLHILVRNDSVLSFAWTGAEARLLPIRRHLLLADPSSRNLTLCESDGTYLSQCALPQNSNAVTGSDLVWSGYWDGYFFTDYVDSTCRLMFWNVGAGTMGEDLQMEPMESGQKSETVLEQQLYERASQLSQKFGVEIRIAEQCALDYSHYATYPLTDPVFVRSALDTLEESLSRYPEGFFRQLCYGSIESIRIELVGGLSIKDGAETHPDSAGGFAQNRGSHYLIVLDGFLLNMRTVFHEVSHIIDARLEWDAGIRENPRYSEDTWLALQPEGFRYAMNYTEVPEELRSYLESGYFITEYSMTFPTEDRAVLMAAAMEGETWEFEPGSGRREKLQYYGQCIRDCFDTTGWPETTSWEQVLQ